VTARAARAYLDVAFFHPFDDGNARLAGLVLQFVLLREGIELDEVAPILTTVRRADDADGAADLARLVHGIAAATRRRRLRAHG
jgi:prophage maintenance system killer protein